MLWGLLSFNRLMNRFKLDLYTIGLWLSSLEVQCISSQIIRHLGQTLFQLFEDPKNVSFHFKSQIFVVITATEIHCYQIYSVL